RIRRRGGPDQQRTDHRSSVNLPHGVLPGRNRRALIEISTPRSRFSLVARPSGKPHMHSVIPVLVAVALLVLFVVASELGFRIGRASARTLNADSKSLVLTIETALLGVIGLLLGFSFSMSAGRFESRRDVMIDEGNAIGTAYLRAGLLADPERDDIRRSLR